MLTSREVHLSRFFELDDPTIPTACERVLYNASLLLARVSCVMFWHFAVLLGGLPHIFQDLEPLDQIHERPRPSWIFPN